MSVKGRQRFLVIIVVLLLYYSIISCKSVNQFSEMEQSKFSLVFFLNGVYFFMEQLIRQILIKEKIKKDLMT